MTRSEQIIHDIETNGTKAKGKTELLKHLMGDRLTIRQMAIARCYDCMGYFGDGRGTDCEMPTCSLYPIMPYRKQGEKYASKTHRVMSEEHKAKLMASRMNRNQK